MPAFLMRQVLQMAVGYWPHLPRPLAATGATTVPSGPAWLLDIELVVLHLENLAAVQTFDADHAGLAGVVAGVTVY
jgi:hypothetical protein